MEMNRGRIGTSSSTGHVHVLSDLADVDFNRQPVEGDVIMFIDGAWRLASIERLLTILAR